MDEPGGDGSPRWSGAVLVGGASRRMGKDKAIVRIDGVPMAERVAGALRRAGAAQVVRVGGERAGPDVDWVPDDHPGEGPLGGLLTALGHAQHDLVVVLACDLVDPSAAAIERLVGRAAGHAAAVPEARGRAQWLHAAWSVRRCLVALRAAFDEGERSLHGAAARLDDVHRFVDDAGAYADADRPEDLPTGR